MTDKEIIKALKCCVSDRRICDKCPLLGKCENNPFWDVKANYVLDLISRQQSAIVKEKNKNSKLQNERNHLKAEIERLNKKVEELSEVLSDHIRIKVKEIKSEAIKEFTKKAKDEVTYYEDPCGNFVPFVDCRHIDNLVKEMVGESNDT